MASGKPGAVQVERHGGYEVDAESTRTPTATAPGRWTSCVSFVTATLAAACHFRAVHRSISRRRPATTLPRRRLRRAGMHQPLRAPCLPLRQRLAERAVADEGAPAAASSTSACLLPLVPREREARTAGVNQLPTTLDDYIELLTATAAALRTWDSASSLDPGARRSLDAAESTAGTGSTPSASTTAASSAWSAASTTFASSAPGPIGATPREHSG
jgi:hypothetical protein